LLRVEGKQAWGLTHVPLLASCERDCHMPARPLTPPIRCQRERLKAIAVVQTCGKLVAPGTMSLKVTPGEPAMPSRYWVGKASLKAC
jgi:hypothetical protein